VDEITGAVISDATVSASLLDASGTAITTFALSPVPTSPGSYQGIIPHIFTDDLTEGETLVVRVVAQVSGSQTTFSEYGLIALKQGGR
jgi:hypothetical protein